MFQTTNQDICWPMKLKSRTFQISESWDFPEVEYLLTNRIQITDFPNLGVDFRLTSQTQLQDLHHRKATNPSMRFLRVCWSSRSDFSPRLWGGRTPRLPPSKFGCHNFIVMPTNQKIPRQFARIKTYAGLENVVWDSPSVINDPQSCQSCQSW